MRKNKLFFIFIFLIVNLASSAQTIKILFDASSAETAGNADWVIDADAHNLGFGSGPAVLNGGNESNAQIIPSPAQSGITGSTNQNYWNGALSYWGIDCVNRNYVVESLPYNGQITYGNGGNAQDLSNYKVFILCEPNILFTATEKTAIMNFVQNGGGLFMVSDHDVSDRNNDGEDSPFILNDLMNNNSVQANPFGMNFDYVNISQLSTNIPSLPGDSILYGPAGNVSAVEWFNGTTLTLNPALNTSVQGVVYKSGSSFGNNNVMCAYARYGSGKVAALGDSSPCDDGSGDSNDNLFDGYIADASGNHRKLLMNITIWLATSNAASPPVADFIGTPLSTCVGQSVTFTDNSTAGVTSYSWNFGSGASPATATSAGPHAVSYSSAGLKTISLIASNANGNNTKTRTDYINVATNCLTEDVGVLSLLSPALATCPIFDNTLQVQVKNFGPSIINFSVDPMNVQMNVTNPAAAIQSFTKTINTGNLAAGATMDVTFDSTYDLSSAGNYIFNANTIFAPDANATNNAMASTTVVVSPGFQSDVTVLSENMGTVTSTTAITIHETNNGFQNDILTMSGTADVRTTTNSSGYPVASGGANVFFTNTAGKNFIISGINTSLYNNLELSFGITKSPSGATGSDFLVQVSSDGILYSNLSIPLLPSGTAWDYIISSGLIPSSANLRIRFTQSGTTNQYRIDDILLVERITSPEITTLDPTTFCQGDSATLTAAMATFYLWSNGMTTQSIEAKSSGSYYVTETNASGCTATSDPISIVVNPVFSDTVNRFIAQGGLYTLPNGQVVSVTGIYNSTFLAAGGCDSSITTNLTVVNTDDNSLCTIDACDSLTGNVSHTSVNIDDGNICTVDGCNPFTGIYHIPVLEICGNGIDDDCDLLIDEACSVTLHLKMFIEGFYIGGGKMQATVDSINHPNVCDTLVVELRSSVSPYMVLYTDTNTIDIFGEGDFVFSGSAQGQSYYIIARHRNSLETWSASPVQFVDTSVNFIFCDSLTKAYGSNLKNLDDGNFAIISGDLNHNGSITLADLAQLESLFQQFLTGFLIEDLNGNTMIESGDYSLLENNIGRILSRP